MNKDWGTCFLLIAAMFLVVQSALDFMELMILSPLSIVLVLIGLGILVWKVLYPPERRRR